MKYSVLRLSAAVVAMSVSGALAGGLVSPIATPEVIVLEPPVAPLGWTGAYVGANIAYAFMGDDRLGVSRNNYIFAEPGKLELSGLNAGLRLGYRSELGGIGRNWLVSGEIAFEGGNIKDSLAADGFEGAVDVNHVLGLRGRAGVLNEARDTWFYGIAGIAQIDYDYSFSGRDGSTGFSSSVEGQTATGYLIGLGVERKLNERLSVTGEWEYANFGKDILGNEPGFPYSTRMTPDYHNIKLGVNYQF
ncbi:MAG: outer membrane beta-barrel protein [Paracoccus sp. (in: a-proteobacteria)]|nr:outer membrane beta-barrel protein [Paracoccus sp. (in: a-proteobacteria)]